MVEVLRRPRERAIELGGESLAGATPAGAPLPLTSCLSSLQVPAAAAAHGQPAHRQRHPLLPRRGLVHPPEDRAQHPGHGAQGLPEGDRPGGRPQPARWPQASSRLSREGLDPGGLPAQTGVWSLCRRGSRKRSHRWGFGRRRLIREEPQRLRPTVIPTGCDAGRRCGTSSSRVTVLPSRCWFF